MPDSIGFQMDWIKNVKPKKEIGQKDKTTYFNNHNFNNYVDVPQ